MLMQYIITEPSLPPPPDPIEEMIVAINKFGKFWNAFDGHVSLESPPARKLLNEMGKAIDQVRRIKLKCKA